MNKEIEVFVPISEYEGFYEVSNLGRIKSLRRNVEYLSKNGKIVKVILPEKIIKLADHPNGYFKVALYKNAKEKRFFVHRLVAIHFIPNPKNKPQVNHKDGNPRNANVNNLEWATTSENIRHSFKELGRKVIGLKGKDNVCSKAVIQYDSNGNFLNEFESCAAAKLKLGLASNHISDCCTGKLRMAYGFIWIYKDQLTA